MGGEGGFEVLVLKGLAEGERRKAKGERKEKDKKEGKEGFHGERFFRLSQNGKKVKEMMGKISIQAPDVHIYS